MKYRNMLKNEDGTHNIVWFGSAGLVRPDSFNITCTIDISGIAYTSSTSNNTKIHDLKNDMGMSLVIPVYFGTTQVRFYVDIMPIINGISLTKIRISSFMTLNPDLITLQNLKINYIYNNKDYTYDLTDITEKDISQSGQFYYVSFIANGTSPNFAIKAPDYVEYQEGIAKSLIQRLSVIKNELWYNINYGFPLLDKVRNKAVFDAYTIKTINAHQEVKKISEFKSSVINRVYEVECKIISIYGDEFDLSYQSNV